MPSSVLAYRATEVGGVSPKTACGCGPAAARTADAASAHAAANAIVPLAIDPTDAGCTLVEKPNDGDKAASLKRDPARDLRVSR
jgi:hypothetical protein